MKRNAVIRIILYSLVVLILGFILFINLFAFFPNRHTAPTERSYAQSMPVSVTQPVDATVADDSGIHEEFLPVNRIEINWAAGSITLMPENIGNFEITERVVSGNPKPMRTVVKDGKLILDYSDEVGLSVKALGSKDLTVLVPMNWMGTKLKINAASASVDLQRLRIGDVEINTASGNCNSSECDFDKLEVNAASADVSFTGHLRDFECEGVSGNAYLTLDSAPQKISMESVSGQLYLNLPEGCGFTVERESLSGKFSCDVATNQLGGHHIYGDGTCRIELEGLSTALNIHHADSEHHEETRNDNSEHHEESYNNIEHHEESHSGDLLHIAETTHH